MTAWLSKEVQYLAQDILDIASKKDKVLLQALKPALAEKLAQMPLLQRGGKGHAAGTPRENASSMLSSGRADFVAWLRGLTLLAELDMSLDPKLLPADVKSSLPQQCVVPCTLRSTSVYEQVGVCCVM